MARRDEFDDEESFLDSLLKRRGEGAGNLRRVLAVSAGLAVLGILGAVIWSASSDGPDTADGSVPIVRADTDPYKVKPEEPGGMAVPNKDSTIFNTLKGQQPDQQTKVENLFEDGEQPVRKDEVFSADQPVGPTPESRDVASKMPDKAEPLVNTAKLPTVTYESPETSEATPPVELKSAVVPEVKSETVPVASTEVKPAAIPPMAQIKTEPVEKIPAAKLEEQATAKSDQTVKKADAVQPSAGAGFFVQLAAVKSEADAKAQWPKYQSQFPSLANLSLRVQKADLGAKGIYYRIQGGPLAEADARKLCSSLNAQKSGSCVVAKR